MFAADEDGRGGPVEICGGDVTLGGAGPLGGGGGGVAVERGAN